MTTVYDCLDPVSRREGLDAAITAARGGRLVVLPTDTVYGIGADAFSPSAVRDLLVAKGRGPDMPVPVLVGSWATLSGLVLSVPEMARTLMEAFWPGGLSIILEHAPSLTWNLGDTRNTVMVRMPLHPVALELLRGVGPMAVSSANIHGMLPSTTISQAQNQLAQSVGVYLDAGPSPVGIASTIVDLTGERPLVRRVGAVSIDRLRAVLPGVVVPGEDDEPDDRGADGGGADSGGAPVGESDDREPDERGSDEGRPDLTKREAGAPTHEPDSGQAADS
jgi:tRNA threonylcarbamoyl adenosine modification protein (Sua5/YciO/YrdC/YwlC family)